MLAPARTVMPAGARFPLATMLHAQPDHPIRPINRGARLKIRAGDGRHRQKEWIPMAKTSPRDPVRDRINVGTPMRCPVCHSTLSDVMIRDLGGVTADITWQIHAGKCAEHGWFQTEVVSRPPREIFAVTRPFGAARRVVVN